MVYSNSLNGEFMLDDRWMVVSNEYIRSWSKMLHLFTDDCGNVGKPIPGQPVYEGIKSGYYRPISFVSFGLDYSIWKLNPVGFHLSNLLFHCINGLLVFIILKNIVKDEKISFLTALFFIIHPIQTEAVSAIQGRHDIVFALFFLLSFYCFIKYESRKFLYLLSIICFCLSILSKEMGITLPLVLILYNLFFRDKKLSLKNLTVIVPYFVVAGLYTLLRTVVLKNVIVRDYFGFDLYNKIILYAKNLTFYLYSFLLPVEVNLLNDPVKVNTVFEPVAFFSVIFLLFAVFMIFYLRKRNKELSFFGFLFIITMIPVSNIFPLVPLRTFRFLYIPIISFCYFLSWAICGVRKKYIASFIFAVLILFFGTRTFLRNMDYKNEIVFFEKELPRVSTKQPSILNCLGLAYARKGMNEKAIKTFKELVAIRPNAGAYRNNLGQIYFNMKDYEKALAEFSKAHELDPENRYISHNVRVTRAKLGL